MRWPISAFCAALLAAAGPRSAAGDGPLFPVRSGGAWGFIDSTGAVLVEPRFERAAAFSEGLAAVKDSKALGYVNVSGELTLLPQFEAAGAVHRPFNSGRAVVRVGSRLGYIDKSGTLVIPARFVRAEDFSDGFALACDPIDCWYIDPSGKPAVSIGLMGGTPVSGGMAAVYLAMSMGRQRVELLDVSKRRRLPGAFDGIGLLSEGVIAAKLGPAWGYVDRSGRGVIAPSFLAAGDFAEGLAAVTDSTGKCGYIVHSGMYAIPPRFGRCYNFSNARARVDLATSDAEGERIAFIDRTGKIVVEGLTADPRFDSAEDFVNGLAAVGAGGEPRFAGSGPLLGYIDPSGHFVWTPRE